MNNKEINEMLTDRIERIPKSITCEYSKIPDGNWCKFYNQHFAGRCPDCENYKLRGVN